RGNPASRFEFVQAPEIEDQCWRHTEINEVGEAVELGTEARGPLEHPSNPAIDPVEQRGKHDGGERKFKLVLHREPDRGQTRAERKQRDQVRQQGPNRDRLEAPPEWRRSRIERRKDHARNIGPQRRLCHTAETPFVSLTIYPLRNARPASPARRSARTVSPAIDV